MRKRLLFCLMAMGLMTTAHIDDTSDLRHSLLKDRDRTVKFLLTIIIFSSVMINCFAKSIVDVHSHIVTKEYFDCLQRHNALMEDGYPLLLKQGLTGQIDIEGNLSKLYYDLAGAPSPQAVKMILTITTPDHILYGSDYPFVPTPILQKVMGKVRSEIMEDPELCEYAADIFTGNALRLFGKETTMTKDRIKQPVVKEIMQSDGIVRLSD